MSFSYWEKTTFIKEPDVIIIGSGIIGLFAAYFLKINAPEKQILVLERGMLPYGASTRNAGFACYGSPSELLNDMKAQTENEVFSLVERRWKGLSKMRKILGDDKIMFEPLGGYEIFFDEDEEQYQNCISFLPQLNNNLFSITGKKNMYVSVNDRIDSFGFAGVKHLILNKGEGQLHTGKLMMNLLHLCRQHGIEIINGVNVDKIEDAVSHAEIFISNIHGTGKGFSSSLRSRKLLICTNGFAGKFLPAFDIKPARAQVLITSPIRNLKIRGSFHYDSGYYYFRNIDDRILFGGGRNLDLENEYTEEFGLTPPIQSRLETMLQTFILPQTAFTIDMRWSGIMGLGNEKSPIIKKTGNNIFCAVRMGGMGVAIGSLVGEEAAKLVLENF